MKLFFKILFSNLTYILSWLIMAAIQTHTVMFTTSIFSRNQSMD